MTEDLSQPNALLIEIEAFLRATGLSPTRFGWMAMRDRNFVFDLRAGREPRRSTERLARAQLARYHAHGQFQGVTAAGEPTKNAAPAGGRSAA